MSWGSDDRRPCSARKAVAPGLWEMNTSAGLASPSWSMVRARSAESPCLKSTLMPLSAAKSSSRGLMSSVDRPE